MPQAAAAATSSTAQSQNSARGAPCCAKDETRSVTGREEKALQKQERPRGRDAPPPRSAAAAASAAQQQRRRTAPLGAERNGELSAAPAPSRELSRHKEQSATRCNVPGAAPPARCGAGAAARGRNATRLCQNQSCARPSLDQPRHSVRRVRSLGCYGAAARADAPRARQRRQSCAREAHRDAETERSATHVKSTGGPISAAAAKSSSAGSSSMPVALRPRLSMARRPAK